MPGLNKEKVAEYIESNQTEDLYRYLLLTQCNALNESLPLMFERMGGFTELLLPNNILKEEGILGRMLSDIDEADWTDQIEIIGWLYQYYNTDLFNAIFDGDKSRKSLKAEDIPSATQLFTPDWAVRYMVENSLGKLWIEGHPNDELKEGWKYYLDEAEQDVDTQAKIEAIRADYRNMKPQDIKVIDKTTPRLIQFYTLINAVNPPFLGGFYFRHCDGIGRMAVLLGWFTLFYGIL